MNLSTVNDLERAIKHVENIIELAKVRGRLCESPRKRVAHVSRTAKWLRKAIGDLIRECPHLRKHLSQFASEGEPTDAELDAACEEK